MKARISKNLKGSIILNSIGPGAMVANREFFMTDEQYWAPDVQLALGKKLIVLLEQAPPTATFHKVTNLGFSSISLPKAGVLRGGRSIQIHSDVVKMDEYQSLKDAGRIAIDLDLEIGDTAKASREAAQLEREKEAEKPKPKRGRPRKEVVVDKPISLKPDSNPTQDRARPIFLKPTGNTVTATEGELNHSFDEPRFVDAENKLERIKKHPVLGKKKIDLDEEDDDLNFVDEEQSSSRRKQHPVLKDLPEEDAEDDGVDFVDIRGPVREHPALKNRKR